MELRVLRYFITIAEEGSISKASEKLELQLLLNNRVSNQDENRGLGLGFFEKNDCRMRLEFFYKSTIFVR